MPRIPAVTTDQAGPVTRVLYRVLARKYGAVPEPFAVAAHHPKLMRAYGVFEVLAERASTELPVSVRELAVYRVAARLGCSWCVDFGTMLQQHDGLDIDRLKAIDEYATSPLYTLHERLALAYADAMTDTPIAVTDEQVAELEGAFGRAGVVELSLLVGLENMRARSNAALGVVDQGFTSGDACRVELGEVRREGAAGA